MGWFKYVTHRCPVESENMVMTDEERRIISDEFKSLHTALLLWFLSDNIDIDKERLKRLFNGSIDSIKEKLKEAKGGNSSQG